MGHLDTAYKLGVQDAYRDFEKQSQSPAAKAFMNAAPGQGEKAYRAFEKTRRYITPKASPISTVQGPPPLKQPKPPQKPILMKPPSTKPRTQTNPLGRIPAYLQ